MHKVYTSPPKGIECIYMEVIYVLYISLHMHNVYVHKVHTVHPNVLNAYIHIYGTLIHTAPVYAQV